MMEVYCIEFFWSYYQKRCLFLFLGVQFAISESDVGEMTSFLIDRIREDFRTSTKNPDFVDNLMRVFIELRIRCLKCGETRTASKDHYLSIPVRWSILFELEMFSNVAPSLTLLHDVLSAFHKYCAWVVRHITSCLHNSCFFLRERCIEDAQRTNAFLPCCRSSTFLCRSRFIFWKA